MNIFFVKKLRKIFSSIDIDCYIERKSGLNFKEHPAKFRIIKIKIIPFIFGILRLAGKLICRFIIKNGHFTTRFAIESAKMNKLNPEKYLEYVLDTLSTKGLTDQNIESVLPYSNKLPKNLYVK